MIMKYFLLYVYKESGKCFTRPGQWNIAAQQLCTAMFQE